MNALEETFRQTMPNEMGYDYLGLSFQEKKAQQGVSPTTIFGMSLLFVFLILAALYESWSLPFSVLLGTPIAVFGAFLTLWLRGMENNIYAQIGLIMLIGLAAKNAILTLNSQDEYEGQTPPRRRTRRCTLTFTPHPIPLLSSSAFCRFGLPAVQAPLPGASSADRIGGMIAASGIASLIQTFYVIERLFAGRKAAAEPQKKPPAESPALV
jgi:HAE1 family hydrophobic/amphiphilic exporter-1